MDYASVTLIATKPKLRENLETVQNKAARVILGAPRWKKVLNFCMEANLFPLDIQIDLMAALLFQGHPGTPEHKHEKKKKKKTTPGCQI